MSTLENGAGKEGNKQGCPFCGNDLTPASQYDRQIAQLQVRLDAWRSFYKQCKHYGQAELNEQDYKELKYLGEL